MCITNNVEELKETKRRAEQILNDIYNLRLKKIESLKKEPHVVEVKKE
jgi:hypothetical protein